MWRRRRRSGSTPRSSDDRPYQQALSVGADPGYPELSAYGTWVSSGGHAARRFNEDFGATVDGEERQALSVFVRQGEQLFHSWSTFARGEEPFMLVFDLLDLTPYGRRETWEDSPRGWPQDPPYTWMRLHDRYEE